MFCEASGYEPSNQSPILNVGFMQPHPSRASYTLTSWSFLNGKFLTAIQSMLELSHVIGHGGVQRLRFKLQHEGNQDLL